MIYYTVEQRSTRHIRDFESIDAAISHAADLLGIEDESLNLDTITAALDKSGEYRRGGVRIAECQDDQ